jgi:hypothetical protein
VVDFVVFTGHPGKFLVFQFQLINTFAVFGEVIVETVTDFVHAIPPPGFLRLTVQFRKIRR